MRIGLLLALSILFQPILPQAQVLTREWVSYFGGQLTNPNQVEYDPVENAVYMVGHTADDTGVATPGSHKDDIGDLIVPSFPYDIGLWTSDFFLARFDTEGNRVWSTYIGGESSELRIIEIEIDPFGYIYLAGQTMSQEGIATPGAYSTIKMIDTTDSYFIMKFSPSGDKLWGTYFDPDRMTSIGVISNNITTALVVDSQQNIYLGGFTPSDIGISTEGTFQTEKIGEYGGFIVKFDTDGNRIWGTYVGSGNSNEIDIVHMGKDGKLYAVGVTNEEAGIGTPGTFQPEPLPGNDEIWYLICLDPVTGTRIWGTYLTVDSNLIGDYIDIISMDTDGFGNIYLYGETSSEVGIATEGVHQEVYGGDMRDAFIMKFDNSGNRVWGTYFGGENMEWFDLNLGGFGTHWGFKSDIRVTADGSKIYICGGTESLTQIETEGCGYEPTTDNHRGFIAEFNNSGTLNWGSYFDEHINSIDIVTGNSKGVDIYFTTRTNIPGLGTAGTHRPEYGEGLYSSGLIGKFTVSCPDYENNIDYVLPNLVSSLEFGMYTWYHNGLPVATTESAIYPIDGDTTGYWFCIAKVCGCEYISDTFYFTGLGLHQPTDVTSWSLYPNPAKDELTLDFGRNYTISEDAELVIVDVLGRNMYQTIIKKGTYQNITVSVKDLPRGIYILRFGVSGIRFIKQ